MYHEIYGKYYQLIKTLLNNGPLTLKQINNFIQKYGFEESFLYLDADALVNTYNLFEYKDGLYYPKTKNKVPTIYTNEQKRLIRNILEEEKTKLFISDQNIDIYKNNFNVKPLINYNYYNNIFQDLDKDPSNGYYKYKFNKILKAIKNNQNLHLTFISNKKNITHKKVAPYKIEYSVQDQKFRLLAIEYRNKIPKRLIKVRIFNIYSLKTCEREKEVDFKYYLNNELLREPLIIEVYPQLNGIERVFIELSNYKREATYDEEKNCSTMKIYYDSSDEGDLIIKLLSFGKIVNIITDGYIKQEVIRRLNMQKQLFEI